MKIKYLGTAAYEGIPSLFCECETCKKARAFKGKNIRTRSQALINDDLLIDFPPDTLVHANTYDIDFQRIHHCLITHSHSDHFYPEDIMIVRDDYNHAPGYKLFYYAGESAYFTLKKLFEKDNMKNTGGVELVKKFKIIKFSHYEVIPLPASHDPKSSPFVYLIKDLNDGKVLLYGNDSGYFSNETMEYIFNNVKHIDLISLDCTGALQKKWGLNNGRHMSLDVNIMLFNDLKRHGIIDAKTIKVSNHFSHNGGAIYDEIAPVAKEEDVIVTYDGLEIDF